LGTLAVCDGSHKVEFRELEETFWRVDVDREKIRNVGWYGQKPCATIRISST